MNFISNNIDINSEEWAGDPCLRFVFKGRFTKTVSDKSSEAWDDELVNNPFSNYVFLWDCTKMDGFDFDARKKWYSHMDLHKHRINHVVIISQSVLMRSAASVMLKYFGIPCTILKTLRELDMIKDKVLDVV